MRGRDGVAVVVVMELGDPDGPQDDRDEDGDGQETSGGADATTVLGSGNSQASTLTQNDEVGPSDRPRPCDQPSLR